MKSNSIGGVIFGVGHAPQEAISIAVSVEQGSLQPQAPAVAAGSFVHVRRSIRMLTSFLKRPIDCRNQVVDDSGEVLAVQPSNVKALFRRAKALLELKMFDKSLRDVLLAEQVRAVGQLESTRKQLISLFSNKCYSFRRVVKRSELSTAS
jgi:hypothetical protein